MKKATPTIIIVLIILIVGYFVYQQFIANKNSTVVPNDSAANLNLDPVAVLEGLTKDTGISFTPVIDIPEMKWNVISETGVTALYFPGKSFLTLGISDEAKDRIRPYFQNLGFEIDIYNSADAVIGGIIGYKQGNTVCVVFGKFSVISEEGTPVPNQHDISVNCGQLSSDLIPPAA